MDLTLIDKTIARHPVLTGEEERRMLDTMPRDEAEKLLVLHNLGLAVKIANRYAIPGADKDDAVQWAILGLVKAAEKFDPGKTKDPDGEPVRFETYAYKVVQSVLSRLANPDNGLASVRVHANTFTLALDEDAGVADVERILSHIEETQPGSQSWADDAELGEAALRTIRNALVDAYADDPSRLLAALDLVRRCGDGASLRALAADGGSVDDIREALYRLRVALLRRILFQDDRLREFGWLFAGSATVRAALKAGIAGACGTYAERWGRVVDARGDRSTLRPRPSTVNWGRFVPARRYAGALTTAWRPDRGSFYTGDCHRRVG